MAHSGIQTTTLGQSNWVCAEGTTFSVMEKYQKRSQNRRSSYSIPSPEQVVQAKGLLEIGTPIASVARETGLSIALVNEVIFKEGLEKPSAIRRRIRLERDAQQKIQRRSTTSAKAANSPRDAHIIQLALNGETLQSIANEVGLTRERVRQILRARGSLNTRRIRRQLSDLSADKEIDSSSKISTWVRTHPGCTVEEISQAFQTARHDVLRLTPSSVRHLIFEWPTKSSEIQKSNQSWSDEDICNSLREASDLLVRVSRVGYDKLRHQGKVDGPSGARIVQRFGSWSTACTLAGISYGQTSRDQYFKHWSIAELIDALTRFLRDSETGTVREYESWRSEEVGFPSTSTICNEFGSWNQARQVALTELRRDWEHSV
jgi:hypothetical protein